MLISTRAAAARLGVGTREITQLAEAGLLGQPQRIGNTVAYDEGAVEELGWPDVAPQHPAALVVRVKPSRTIDGGDRAFIGYAVDYGAADNETTRRDALRGWWPVRNPDRWVGNLLVVTLASFVVAVYQIEGVERAADHPRVMFKVGTAPVGQASKFLKHRLRLPAGPVAMPLEATD